MFWTTLVRGWNKVFLVLGIIASVIAGIALWGELEGFALLVMLGGIFVCFISVSVIMMISEISVSLHELNEKNSANQNINSSVPLQTMNTSTNSASKTPDSWVCRCGARNSFTAKFCRKCGSPASPSNISESRSDTWICPACGDKNPATQRICKGCGRDK